jgi:hypothetical protein
MSTSLDDYIPTPLRRRLGLHVPQNHKIEGDRLASRIDTSDGPQECWLWTGPVDRYGYGVVARTGRAHRLVWEQHHGRKLGIDEVVRHSCDNPRCCNPKHLLLGSQIDNVADRVERDRSAKGALNGRAKLTATKARAIYASRKMRTDLAAQFGIDESTVRDIKSGKTWAWATGHIPKFAAYSKNGKGAT